MKIKLYPRLTLFGRKWFFRIIGNRGKILAQSEAYSRRIDAFGTANALKNGLAKAEIEDA